MSLVEPQLIPIPFAGGLDTKTDPAQVPQGKLLELENGQFTKGGQISKRFGYDILSTKIEGGGTITSAKAISSFDDELLLFDGLNVYSHIAATGRWINRGMAVSVIAQSKTIVRMSGVQQLNPDVAFLSGVEVYAWEDSRNGVRYAVVDRATGAFLVSDGSVSSASTAFRPKVIAFAGFVYIFYTDTNTLFFRRLNPKNPTVLQSAVTLLTDGFSAFAYDASVIGDKLFIAYLSNSTVTGAIQIFSCNELMATSGAVVVTNTAGHAQNTGYLTALTVKGDALARVWVGWTNGTDVRAAIYTYNLVSLLSETVVDAAAEAVTISAIESDTSSGVMQFAYEVVSDHSADVASKHKVVVKSMTVAGSVALVGTLRSVGIAAKAFVQGGINYLTVAHDSTLQSTYFTVRISSIFPVVAKIAYSNGGGLRTNQEISETVQVESGVFLWANLVAGKLESEGNVIFSLLGVSATNYDFAHPNKFLSVTQSRNLLFVGGVVQSYDGVSVTEHGFHLYPETVSLTATGSDGHLLDGSYLYCATYEWTDNLGQIQRSAPCVPVSVDVTADNHVAVVIPTLRLTLKRDTRRPPSVVVYRTTANGTVFHRVTSVVSPLANDPTADTVTFNDILSDTDLQENELLYTSGNVLANIAPPACTLISHYQNRVVVGGLEDPNLLWFSKNKFDNTNFSTIPCEFAAENTIGCDPRGGPITALGLLDDKLILFKQASIFVVGGDGPNDTGGGEAFADPQFITTDVGCKNPNSVVMTPVGLMFQSDKGIYLLDRSLSASYIGSPVEKYNDLEITSATLDQDANQVIFTTATGPALIYDYFFQQWGTWTNHDAEDSDSFSDVFVFAKSSGKVYLQNRTKFTDGGAFVRLRWATPNLSFAGLSGYQRVFSCWLLGMYKGPHSLRVEVAYDYNGVYTDLGVIDASQTVTVWGSDVTWGASSPWGGEFRPYQFRINFARQKCTAIRLRVSDDQASNYTEGYSISAMTFKAGALRGGAKLPATSQVGTSK